MCGIAGSIQFKGKHLLEDRKALEKFSEPLRFRGPDSQGYHSEIKDGVSIQFTHRRLSIIDLSESGSQPMHSNSGESIIIFNGEIYNYKVLKAELKQLGASFKTESDTEVILSGYEIWGVDKLLSKLDGMFAFGLYSFRNQELILARDRFGKKPLYYYHEGANIVFSSDIRSFNAVPTISKTLNHHALGYFFSELSVPDPQSIWNEIKKVPAAHYLQIGQEQEVFKCVKYWNLAYQSTCTLSQNQIIDYTDELLTRAIEKRLVADVNVAAQLSGGIDSSLITAKMAQMTNKPVATYSVGFDNEKYNELPYARMIADRYQTNHHEILMQAQDIGKTHKLILEYGEPFADISMIPSYMVADAISSKEKVVCGGDGGDELFAGYYLFYLANKMDAVRWASPASGLVNLMSKILPTYRVRFFNRLLRKVNQPDWMLLNRNYGFGTEDLSKLVKGNTTIVEATSKHHQKIWNQYFIKEESTLKNLLRTSVETRLLNDYLVKVDRASMFASLEMRSPFLDKDLAEFAFSLTNKQLFYHAGTKSILKKLAERYAPKELIYRNKMGFAVPIGEWFRGDLKQEFKEMVLGGKQQLIPMDYNFIENLFKEHCEGKDYSHKLWALYVYHLWAQNQEV